MRLLALSLVLLSACLIETFTDGEDGTVYECAAPDGSVLEWCSLLDASELGAETGRTCQRTDRWWPVLTNALGNGCVWSCEPHQGCNAKQGCYGCP